MVLFLQLSRLKRRLAKLIQEERHLKNSLLQEEQRLLAEKQTEESRLRASLSNFKDAVVGGFLNINAHTTVARQIANDKAPWRLNHEWAEQQKVIADLMGQADEQNFAASQESPRLLSRPWSDSCWTPSPQDLASYRPQTSGLAPGILRIGELLIERELGDAKVPALLPLRALSSDPNDKLPGHIVIFSNDSHSRQAATAAIESMALRTMSTFPIRKLQGIFVDPVSMGNSFPFKSLPKFMVGQQTFTRDEDIKDQLRKLTLHTEQVIQNYLSRYYESIEDYNVDKTSIEEAYRYLFVADFPTNFNNAACEDLKSLLINGAKAGVYVVIHVDDTLEKPRDFSYDLFDDYCTVVRPAHGLTTGGSFNQGGSLKAGYVYIGRVTRIIHTGAFVEFLPGKEGFIQTSQLAEHRISKPEEVVSIGQVITVKVSDVDGKGRVNLTRIGIQHDEANAVARKAFNAEDFNAEDKPLFTMQLPNGLAFNLTLDHPPSNDQFNQITHAITEASRNIKIDTVPFTELYPSSFWTADSRKEIRSPIGVTGARDKVDFWMGNNEDGLVVSSGLLAGKPGAGKSFTLHAAIISLAMNYSPDELELYLLDFKEGVEFQTYVDPDKSEKSAPDDELDELKALPHAKVISIESDREFGLSVLQKVQQEIEDRGAKFKSVGVSNLKDYRDKTDEKMPRVLVVVDEFQYMFQENDKITQQLNPAVEDITRRGRAFGVHLLLASQSPNVPNMSRGIYSFIELRMAMQMDQNTAISVLAEGNTSAVDLLDRPGKLIYNKDFGRKGHNEIGQVADASLAQRQDALKQIQAIALESGYKRRDPLVLFNGTRPTSLSHNGQLTRLSEMDNWLPSSSLNKQMIQEPDWLPQEFPGVAWLGEAMRIGNHTRAIFRRRPRSNLLLVGASEETIFGVLGGALLSLVHCYAAKEAEFQILDLSQSPDGEDNYWGRMTLDFRNQFHSCFPITVGKRFPEPEHKIGRAETILENVYAELERRQKLREDNPDEINFGASLFFVCAIGGLNRAQNLRPVAGRIGDEMSGDTQKLLKICSQGSELGIHTILWLDNAKTVLQLFGDKQRAALTQFDMRTGLTMSADDSRTILGETYAQNLPRLRAYFSDLSNTTGLEKFKPYAVPSPAEIRAYSQRLQQRLS
jgi:DNA segregation ATPase FtsK/SpoIIIE, S-DNA-T family